MARHSVFAKALCRLLQQCEEKHCCGCCKHKGAARGVLEALLDKYMDTGIYEMEKTEVLKLDPFLRMGKPSKIAGFFGGKAGYLKAVQELEEEIYAEEAV